VKVNLNRAVLLCVIALLTIAVYILANDYYERTQIANRLNAKYGIKINLYKMSLKSMLTYEEARDNLELEVNTYRMKTLYLLRNRNAVIEQHKTTGREQLHLYNDDFHNIYDRSYNKIRPDMNNFIMGPGKLDEEYRYKSISGMKYKYDLTIPGDKLLYDLDIKAKMYDDIDPWVEMDRSMGQFGGGIKR